MEQEIIEKIYKEQKLRRLVVDYIETNDKDLKDQLYNIIIELMKDLKII